MFFQGCITLTTQNDKKLYKITITRKVKLGNLPSISTTQPAPSFVATFYRLADTILPFHSIRSFLYSITNTDQIQLLKRIAVLDAKMPSINFCVAFNGEDNRL